MKKWKVRERQLDFAATGVPASRLWHSRLNKFLETELSDLATAALNVDRVEVVRWQSEAGERGRSEEI